MKKKHLLLFIFLTMKIFSQNNNNNYLKCIILIDGQVPETGVYDCFFELKNDEGNILKKIPFAYNIGQFNFVENEYKELINLDSKAIVLLKFKYRQVGPEFIERIYEKELKGAWLNQSYLILKIYNYDNKFNKLQFNKKIGYGIEISTATFSTVLPRKK